MQGKPLERGKLRRIAVTGLLSAICIILGSTPLGFIPMGAFGATIVQIPVIIGVVIEGPVVGLTLGMVFGVMSLLRAWLQPTLPMQIVFINPLVSVFPRLVIPLVAWAAFKLGRKWSGTWLGDALAGVFGSLTNTVGVLGVMALLYTSAYTKELLWPMIGAAALANGIPEAIVSAIVTVAVAQALRRSIYK